MGLCLGDKKRGRVLQAKDQGRKGKQKEHKVSSPALQSEDNLPKERGNFVVVIVVVCREIFTFLCARAFCLSCGSCGFGFRQDSTALWSLRMRVKIFEGGGGEK